MEFAFFVQGGAWLLQSAWHEDLHLRSRVLSGGGRCGYLKGSRVLGLGFRV